MTLDGAYDFGGAGAGRKITSDTGAVRINKTSADANNALEILVSAGTGAGIKFVDGGLIDESQPCVLGPSDSSLFLAAGPAPTTTSSGNATEIAAGPGGTISGNGGELALYGGPVTVGNGGVISFFGRNGVGTNKAGGAIAGTAGNPTGSGAGGSISWTSGNGGATGTAGTFTATGGAGGSTSGAAGDSRLFGGPGGATGTVAGAAVVGGGLGFDAATAGGAIISDGKSGSGTTRTTVMTVVNDGGITL